jgi:hypothetical protein
MLLTTAVSDHSSGSRRIGQGTSINPAQLHLLTVAPAKPSRQFTSVIAISEGFSSAFLHALRPGQSKKCLTTTRLASAWLPGGITYRWKPHGELLSRRGDHDMRGVP